MDHGQSHNTMRNKYWSKCSWLKVSCIFHGLAVFSDIACPVKSAAESGETLETVVSFMVTVKRCNAALQRLQVTFANKTGL